MEVIYYFFHSKGGIEAIARNNADLELQAFEKCDTDPSDGGLSWDEVAACEVSINIPIHSSPTKHYPPIELQWFFEISIRTEKKKSVTLYCFFFSSNIEKKIGATMYFPEASPLIFFLSIIGEVLCSDGN